MTTPNAHKPLTATRFAAVERVVLTMAAAFQDTSALGWNTVRIRNMVDDPRRLAYSQIQEFLREHNGNMSLAEAQDHLLLWLPKGQNLRGLGLVSQLSVVRILFSCPDPQFRARYRAGYDALAMMAASGDRAAELLAPVCTAVQLYHGELPVLKGDW